MARQRNGSGGGIISIIMFIGVLIGMYYLASGLMWVVGLLGPILFVVAFFLNRSVVTGWFKSIFKNFKTNPLMSVGKALLTFFAFPFVGAYLFGKAVIKNKVAEAVGQTGGQRTKKNEYTEYEEVKDSQPTKEKEDDFLDISEIEQQLEDLEVKETVRPKSTPKAKQAKPPKPESNKYDNLFD